jgi:hypothetical protein
VYPTDTINILKGMLLQDSNYIVQTVVKHLYGNLRMFLLHDLYSAHKEAIQDQYDFLCKVKEHEWQVKFEKLSQSSVYVRLQTLDISN